MLLGFIFLLERKIHFTKLGLQGFIFMVKGLAYFSKLFNFLAILLAKSLHMKTFLVKLFDLDLVVLGIEKLPSSFGEFHPEHFNLVGQPLDFNSLEDNNKLNIIAEVSLLIVGQVLDNRSKYEWAYFLRSSLYAKESATRDVDIKFRFAPLFGVLLNT